MSDKARSFQDRIGNGFIMSGPLTSGGLTYKVSPLVSEQNEYKNAFNTDIARERGIVKKQKIPANFNL